MTIGTRDGAWVVPPNRAVWIPAEVSHLIAMSGAVAMRTLYLKPGIAMGLPQDCCVINVSALLKELILYACTLRALKKTEKWQDHLIGVILHQFETVQIVSYNCHICEDSKASSDCTNIVRCTTQAIAEPLLSVAESSVPARGPSKDYFQQEIGMTFGKWRQQLRLMQAMRLLAEGAKVTHAALESGYSTPSAFISMLGRSWVPRQLLTSGCDSRRLNTPLFPTLLNFRIEKESRKFL